MRGIELRQLRYFALVARELHFRRAAELAFITQPALSQQIAKLEETLGVALFTRSRSHVALTPAGVVLRDQLDQMFEQYDLALRLTRAAGLKRPCRVSIGLIEYTNLSFLPPALARLQAQYPHIRIERHEMNSVLQMEALRKSTIDLGIGVQMTPLPDDGSVRAQPILRSRWSLLMRPDHPLAARERLTLDDLAGARIIMFERRLNPELYDRLLATCAAHGFQPDFFYETSQAQVGMSMVGQGLGVMLGATYVFSSRPDGLVRRPIDGMDTLTVNVFSRGAEAEPLILEFITLLAQEARRIQVCHQV